MRSQRQLRVGEEVRHALATVLMRGDVPWPQGFPAPVGVTVTEVQVSPDLKNATAFVMPLGGKNVKETIRTLNDIVGFFRHTIAKEVQLRHVPKLRFVPDETFEVAARIDQILHDPEVAKDLAPHHDPEDDD